MEYTHVVDIKELDDNSGNVYIEFPPQLLNKLGWKEGDDLRFDPGKDGSIRVKKVNLETVTLDFDEGELFKYMQRAHEEGISFNELCERALRNNECG